MLLNHTLSELGPTTAVVFRPIRTMGETLTRGHCPAVNFVPKIATTRFVATRG